MSAIGWQIGASLVGVSALIIAIYLAKLLQSATKVTDSAVKVTDKAFDILDTNEKHIEDVAENTASITERVDTALSVISGISELFKILNVAKVKNIMKKKSDRSKKSNKANRSKKNRSKES